MISKTPSRLVFRRNEHKSVYLSSTLTDLSNERSAVRDIIVEAEWVLCHSYRASERDLISTCLDDVVASDLYIGIIGQRYGYIPSNHISNPENKSITELEFDTATQMKIQTFIFLKSENGLYRPADLDSHTGENEAGRRIAQFRNRLSSGQLVVTDIFDTIESLRIKFAQLIGRLKGNSPPGQAQNSKRRARPKPSTPPHLGKRPDDKQNLALEQKSTLNLWQCELAVLPQGPMVRDVSFINIPELLTERYSSGEYVAFIGIINRQLKEAALQRQETPERFGLGRLPQTTPHRFFQELLQQAALNGPRSLITVMRVLNVKQFDKYAAQEIEAIEQAVMAVVER